MSVITSNTAALTSTQLTELETEALKLIGQNKVEYFDDGYEEGSSWGFALSGAIEGYMNLSAQAAGGVMSSLVQKGLILTQEYDGDTVISVSAAGVEIIKGLVA